jgi:hypothetical protein
MASVFGREFDLAVLAAAVGREEDGVLDQLEVALGAGLVTEAPAGRDRFAFSHDLVHHTLCSDMTASRLARMHVRAADALEVVHGDDLGDHAAEVATHLLSAADPALGARTFDRCRRAGQRAALRHAPADAVEWFSHALVLLDDRHDPNLSLRARLLVELGTQQRNGADSAHRSTLIEAGRIGLEAGDVEALVESVLANSRGMNTHVWELDQDRIDLLRSELARRVGEPNTLARVLVRVSRARNFRLGRHEFRAVAEEVGALAGHAEITDPLLIANCLTTVLNTSLQLGDADQVAWAMAEIWRREEEVPLPVFTLAGHLSRGLAAGLRGDVVAYELASVATFEHAIEIGDEEARFIFEGQLFYTRYLQGRTDELLDAIVQDRSGVSLYRAVSAILHAEAGKLADARGLLDAELALGFESSVDMFEIQALTIWAKAAASVRHFGARERLVEVLGAHTDEVAGHLVQVTEPIDICLGRLCSLLGRYDEAESHFAAAMAIADGFGGVWMRAHTQVSRALMLSRRGDADDLELALELAREALTMAESEGYRSVGRDAERLLGLTAP